MSFIQFFYKMIFGPLILLFDVIYSTIYYITFDNGISIIILSLTVNFLILPLYKRADAMQEEERVRNEKLSRGVKHIKCTFRGDERFMMLQTYYRQNNYKPYYSLAGSVSLLLEIPFFIAAYSFLSNLDLLNRASFYSIRDLGQPDGLLNIAGHTVNLLPILMTLINIVSGIIYTKGMPVKSKIQLYGMALIFLVFLYSSPSGLVFYWTLNNLFSLVKNIFYRLKNPKLVLYSISAAIGLITLPYILFVAPMRTTKIQVFVVGCMILLTIPLAVHIIIKYKKISFRISEANKTDKLIFLACCSFMAVLTGLLIPSAVIKSSPAEFINISDYHSPLRYTAHSLALAAGVFLVWMNVFYNLSSSKVKRILTFCAIAVSGAAITDYWFFGKNYGQMSSLLQYDSIMYTAGSDYWLNTVILIVLIVGLYLLWKKSPVLVRSISFAAFASAIIMSCVNIFSINSYLNKISGSIDEIANNQGISISLDKKEKNVVVIMLDRGISDFFPFIIEEKPELKDQFAGFTYYPNTMSYGNSTMVASPALFGGYEYIPENINKRSDKTIPEKTNEALKVMPVLFSQNGYNTTVCDPPYAGFNWLPDLTIYNDYPEISRYNTKSIFSDNSNSANQEDPLERNFFAHSIMRSAPVLLHLPLYNKGLYNHYSRITSQSIADIYTAHGSFYNVDSYFIGAYNTLKALPAITKSDDSGHGTFLMLANDTAHDPVMLKEPEYEPSLEIDNREYEEAHSIRRTANGKEMQISTVKQMTHYQCNAAAFIQLGKWMDYLRDNGVYDNTKIIIVSDHGRDLDYLFDEHITEGTENGYGNMDDPMIYKALLLVKDFNSKELVTDNSFMTNADTPAIAFDGLINDPVNPFTGKKMTSDEKNNAEHHIITTDIWLTTDYKGSETEFLKTTWLGLKGNDTSDMSAWRIIGEKLQ